MFCFFGGGLGGNPEGDGLNHGNNPISTATIPPAEILEALYPVMFTRWAFRPDSAGPGRHRGGLGAIYEIETLADGDTEVFLLGERGKFPPFGVNGGKPAALNRFFYATPDGERSPPLVSKITDVRIRRGMRVRLETPGGGGFGDPLTREPAASPATWRSVTSRSRRRAGITASPSAPTTKSTAPRPRACAVRRAHERAQCGQATVGVDVGGTFTDLFCFDEATRSFRVAKVPSNRGDEAAGFLQGLQASAPSRVSARSCTAPRSAPTRCWSGAARASA